MSYPIDYIANARIPCMGPHPKNIILLCCDAFGVLPPVSRLTTQQAMYHFISGYTAKVRFLCLGSCVEGCSPCHLLLFTCALQQCALHRSASLTSAMVLHPASLALKPPVVTVMIRDMFDAESIGAQLTDYVVEYSAIVLQVAGTEQGVTEPEATFSACFGGAFLMLHPMKVRDAPTPSAVLVSSRLPRLTFHSLLRISLPASRILFL